MTIAFADTFIVDYCFAKSTGLAETTAWVSLRTFHMYENVNADRIVLLLLFECLSVFDLRKYNGRNTNNKVTKNKSHAIEPKLRKLDNAFFAPNV